MKEANIGQCLIDDYLNNNNKEPNLFPKSNDSSKLSVNINKNNTQKYYILCKCGKIPIISFFDNGEISYLCSNCKQSPIVISIKKIFELLFKSDEIDIKSLKCKKHDEKYTYYLKEKRKSLCWKCMKENFEEKAMFFGRDIKIISKCKYIQYLIEKNGILEDDDLSNNIEDDSESEKNNRVNNILESENKNEENIEINGGDAIIKINENSDEDEKDYNAIINFSPQLNNKNDPYKKLFNIIINSNKDYPNYEYRKIISNCEKYANLYYEDFNKIKLKYEFNEEDIKEGEIQLFGVKFVNTNRDNCFLIINRKLYGLKAKIKLSKIFGDEPINYPFKLEVNLIERKKKAMQYFSFMFDEISTITSESSFDGYDSYNIRSMKNMFYNCNTLKNLPDISKLNTKYVENMSNMFYNCCSLKKLPDISKWNTENLKNANSMFENCSSLSISSFPRISSWNTKKILYMNRMFKNCKLLKNLPNFLNWNIKPYAETSDMYEGIIGYENQEIINSNKEETIIARTIFYLVNPIYKLWNKIYFFFSSKYFKMLLILILLTFIFALPISKFYSLYSLESGKVYINNPIEYFHSINNTNIKYIQKCLNITNSSIIYKNKEKYINEILNFTSINGNITFETSSIKNIIYNSFSIFMLFAIIISFSLLFSELKKIKGNFIKSFFLFISIILLFIISFIVNILGFVLKNKLITSIRTFNKKINNIFKNKEYLNKVNEFFSLRVSIFINILEFLASMILFIYFCEQAKLLIIKKNEWNKLENLLLKRKNNNSCYILFKNILKYLE